MGGGSYYRDIDHAYSSLGNSSRSSNDVFSHNDRISDKKDVHIDLNIKNKIRECCDSLEHPEVTPIVVAMDVTSSRGDDAKVIYEQVPKMLASIKISNIVPDPAIMWAAIGDATVDVAPIQVTQFEADERIDDQLSKIWMEEGGGGTGEESYELLAYFLANKVKMDSYEKRSKKGVLFITGDDLQEDISTKKIFKKLQEKFDVFLIFPKKTMKERKQNIDTEIKKRLEMAGGRFEDVSIRASLIWNNRNDLDLHCITPKGEHIYFSDKQSSCGGYLDVDRNVRGETTKPVENIRWEKGRAPAGKYHFYVENYSYHEGIYEDIPFRVELDIDGKIQTFKSEIKAGQLHGDGRVTAFEFEYDPFNSNKVEKNDYKNYEDDVILAKWRKYIPENNIVRIENPKSSVDTMLAILSLRSGIGIEKVSEMMRDRAVKEKRIIEVVNSVSNYSKNTSLTQVDEALFA